MCFPCSAGSRNICTHWGEHGCWSPQVNGSLDQALRFVDFLYTPVTVVSQFAHTSYSWNVYWL
jgi:hypothetical protein